jgi:hypothetical protein
MSLSSVLSTCVYLYFMMDLLVKVYFREHPLLVTEYVDRSGQDADGEATKVIRNLQANDKDNVPSIYILSDFPQQQIIDPFIDECCYQDKDGNYILPNE